MFDPVTNNIVVTIDRFALEEPPVVEIFMTEDAADRHVKRMSEDASLIVHRIKSLSFDVTN